MCSEDCCSKEDHLLECEVFSSAGFKVKYHKFDYENFEPLYDIFTPIRMLALKDKKPTDWQNLKSLMSHLDIWKKDPRWVEDHEFAANFILENVIMNVKKDDILGEKLVCVLQAVRLSVVNLWGKLFKLHNT